MRVMDNAARSAARRLAAAALIAYGALVVVVPQALPTSM
jgi:hypothetical protein